MRIGLFGGSFDPVHNGHLAVARACREAARLHDVWFVPTAVQPHKPHGPVASDAQRVEMLRLAGVRVSMVEVERGGVSYTVDTLRDLRRAYPDHEWFLLMGADTLHDLSKWREPTAILSMATPLVVHRPGEASPDFSTLAGLVEADRLQAFIRLQVEMDPIDIGSSEIRRKIAACEPISEDCPPPVAEYLAQEELYLG